VSRFKPPLFHPDRIPAILPAVRRKRIIQASVLLLLIAGIAFAAFHNREPRYKGRTLGEWLMTEDDPKWCEAVAAIGAPAIPHLVRWMQYEQSPLLDWLERRARAQNGMVPKWVSAGDVKQGRTEGAFSCLTEHKSAAAAELIPLLRSKKVRVRRSAARALQFGSPDAVPALLEALNDPDRSVALFAASSLGILKPHAGGPAVTFLIRQLQDQSVDSYMTVYLVHVLGTFGTNAQAARPVLLKMEADQPGLGNTIRRALDKIDPPAISPSTATK
jgi:hypothetical protein